MANEVWRSGGKKVRTRNLTSKQEKKAVRIVGGGKSEKVTQAERAAMKKSVDIGQTKWTKASERGGKGVGGLLTDASGKAVTGTVKLASGKTATYVRGKRIGVVGGGTGSGGAGGRGGSGMTAAQRAAAARAAADARKRDAAERAAGARTDATSRSRNADRRAGVTGAKTRNEMLEAKQTAAKNRSATAPRRSFQTVTTRREAAKTPLQRIAEEQAARWKRSEARAMVNNPNAKPVDWAVKARERETAKNRSQRPRVGQTRQFVYGRGGEEQTYRANGKWEVTRMWKNGKSVPVPSSRRWSD